MIPRFNLLDEPWLPVRLTDGRVLDVSLLEAFERAGEIAALAETAPPSLIAQYRLLLVLTHRALTLAHESWKDKDRARWYREGLPQGVLRDYLELWRERFWLFHADVPFFQAAALAQFEETADKRKPWSQISLASSSGNTALVFDHSCDERPTPIAPAEALRCLLGFLQFTPGGLVKTLRSSDKAGPLANSAAVLPLGDTLQQTLCLALHPCTSRTDLPSWERAPVDRLVLLADASLASGPNDRYTRLSRAVLLDENDDGLVQWLRFAAGVALEDDANAPDPMASYRAGSNSLVRLSFREGRALWRDLPALVPDEDGKVCQPAATLSWAANLNMRLGFHGKEQPLLVAGLASDQAKLLRWRCERIALPTALLTNPQLAGYLRYELRRAENIHEQLRSIATGMYAETMPDPHSKDTRARARAIVDGGAAAVTFFVCAERGLPQLLHLIGAGAGEEADRHWSEILRQASEECWGGLCRNLGRSPLAFKAEARFWPRFRGLLYDQGLLESNLQSPKEAHA